MPRTNPSSPARGKAGGQAAPLSGQKRKSRESLESSSRGGRSKRSDDDDDEIMSTASSSIPEPAQKKQRKEEMRAESRRIAKAEYELRMKQQKQESIAIASAAAVVHPAKPKSTTTPNRRKSVETPGNGTASTSTRESGRRKSVESYNGPAVVASATTVPAVKALPYKAPLAVSQQRTSARSSSPMVAAVPYKAPKGPEAIKPARLVTSPPPRAAAVAAMHQIRTPPRPSSAEKKSPFQSPHPAGDSVEKVHDRKVAAASQSTTKNRSSGPYLLMDDEPQQPLVSKPAANKTRKDDNGYETGDLDDNGYVSEDDDVTGFHKVVVPEDQSTDQSPAVDHDKAHKAVPKNWWATARSGLTTLLLFTLLWFGLIGPLWTHLPSLLTPLTSLESKESPCFATHWYDAEDSDTGVGWSDRCAQVAAKDKLKPCPPGGWCRGGDLVSCGGDNWAWPALVTATTGTALLKHDTCSLSEAANDTVKAVHDLLHEWTLKDMCQEHLPTTIQGHVEVDGVVHDRLPLFDYYDVARTLEEAGKASLHDVDWKDALVWMEYAVENGLLTSLSMQRKPDDVVWVGLALDEEVKLSLPAACVAKQTIVKTLAWVKAAAWKILIQGLLVLTWKAAWFVVDVCWGVFNEMPLMATGSMLTISIIVSVISSHRRNTAEEQRLRKEVDSAEARVHDALMGHPDEWHRAVALRDAIKNEFFPNNKQDQLRFTGLVWPHVTRRVHNDERILMTDKLQNSQVIEVWKWQGTL
jgi:hypothetical protein